ncbi:hypothetical protein BFW01_g10632 [Lasiodiplodia theobromae]|uniref:Zn(2)-C6 fungal-type domain-containing protein n=1 Tax=Lasiodiplodia theobromae TaxID=45133 RepID=A0A8H7IP40_9PEZI|nr:Protein kinase subdomain-containing protein [Lasiodiplodia theobromae]KAF4539957.1 Protein kinase subdomain-containing protein [Lasiodiplodia theobromae]KAF9629429.1 hypothetical protein BFW01_g10632 [Lasiodiplodia theobromae]
MMDSIPAPSGAAPAELAGTRTCHFCRTRGLRCSGQSVCDACRAHDVECAYAAYGGARQPNKPFYNPPRTEILSGYASPGPSLASTAATPSETSGGQRQLVDELEHVAHRLFVQTHVIPAAELQRSGYWHGAATRDPPPTGLKLPYRDVFNGLAQSIVELFLIRFNSLGCSPREQTTLTDLSKLFFQQQPLPSFSIFASPIPPQSFADRKVQQLIEVWFAHHPLSFVLSKTLLLQSYRNGTHDSELLALVLAEASFLVGHQDVSSAEAFVEAARARVLERPALSLSTTQALVLLGWHDFCLNLPRQGYCYLEFARMVAAQCLSESRQASPGDNHMNGVNLQTVETELFQRIYWLTSSVALWVSLQQSCPDFDVLSPLDTASLPPADLSTSTVYSLDETSGNIASLVAQKTGVRELWSLAHLTSTIAPIFKLCLLQRRHGSSDTAAQQQPYWTAPTPPPMPPRPLLTSQPIHSLLADARSRLPAQLDHSNPSQTFTCSAYQLLAIHAAFFSPPPSPTPTMTPMDDGQLQQGGGGKGVNAGEVLHSIQTFLAATQTLQRQAALQDLFGGRDHDVRTAPWVVLGLDTCGRAVARLRQGGAAAHTAVQEAAEHLWDASGHQKLRSEPGLRIVRERLARLVGKEAVQRQQQQQQQQQQQAAQSPSSLSPSSILPSQHEELWTGGIGGLEVTWSGEPDLSNSAADLLDAGAPGAPEDDFFGEWNPVMY